MDEPKQKSSRKFAVGLARAFAGAILFSLPMMMTMEMWQLGFTISGFRLALLIILDVPLLIGLSYFVGFEETDNLTDDVIDAFVAFAVGFTSSATLLYLFGVINSQMSAEEIIGKISVQTVSAGIGAMLAQSQLGSDNKANADDEEQQKRRAGYFGQLFIMLVGALFLSLNVAPTEEIILINFQSSEYHTIATCVLTLLLMHAFVYAVGFQGQRDTAEKSFWSVFALYTVGGYALTLLACFALLWLFGRTDGTGFGETLDTAVILAFPAGIGAAASRLIL